MPDEHERRDTQRTDDDHLDDLPVNDAEVEEGVQGGTTTISRGGGSGKANF